MTWAARVCKKIGVPSLGTSAKSLTSVVVDILLEVFTNVAYDVPVTATPFMRQPANADNYVAILIAMNCFDNRQRNHHDRVISNAKTRVTGGERDTGKERKNGRKKARASRKLRDCTSDGSHKSICKPRITIRTVSLNNSELRHRGCVKRDLYVNCRVAIIMEKKYTQTRLNFAIRKYANSAKLGRFE